MTCIFKFAQSLTYVFVLNQHFLLISSSLVFPVVHRHICVLVNYPFFRPFKVKRQTVFVICIIRAHKKRTLWNSPEQFPLTFVFVRTWPYYCLKFGTLWISTSWKARRAWFDAKPSLSMANIPILKIPFARPLTRRFLNMKNVGREWSKMRRSTLIFFDIRLSLPFNVDNRGSI